MSDRASITNAQRISLICYDPSGDTEDPEDLANLIGRDGFTSARDMRRGIRCEHVASAWAEEPVTPQAAHELFYWWEAT